MTSLKNIIILIILCGGPLSASAIYACPKQQRVEIEGAYRIPSELIWNEVDSPDIFITDVKKIPRINKTTAIRIKNEFLFKQDSLISRAFISDKSDATVVYSTEAGDLMASRIFLDRLGGYTCMPGASINGEIKKMPASINFVKSKKTEKCMWQIDILDQHKSISHTFYNPTSCSPAPTNISLKKLTSIIEKLI